MSMNINTLPKGAPKERLDLGVPQRGMRVARLQSIVTLGTQVGMVYKDEKKPDRQMVTLGFELPRDLIQAEGTDFHGKPHILREDMAVSGHEKSKLVQRYTALDPLGKANGEFKELLGAACTVQVAHKEGMKGTKSEGRTFANINDVTEIMEGLDVPPLINPPLYFDFYNPDKEALSRVPKFLRDKMLAALDISPELTEMIKELEEEYKAKSEEKSADKEAGRPAASSNRQW